MRKFEAWTGVTIIALGLMAVVGAAFYVHYVYLPSITPQTPPIQVQGVSDANVITSADSGKDVQSETAMGGGSLSAQTHVAQIAALNTAWIRMDANWQGIETSTGVYNFGRYGAAVDSYTKQGLGALIILDYTNPLYTGTSTRFYVPPDAAGFQRFLQGCLAYVSHVVEHFKGEKVRYEIWNEPYGNFWTPVPTSTQYATLAIAATKAIRAVDPSAVITTAALSGGGTNESTTFMQQFLSDGGGVSDDAVSAHPYRRTVPETVISDYGSMLGVIRQYLSTTPFWVTEWGYPSDKKWFGAALKDEPDDYQAKIAAREFLSSWIAGFGFVSFYTSSDPPLGRDNPEGWHWGCYTSDWVEKPSGYAVSTLLGLARGKVYEGRIAMANPDFYAVKLDNDSEKTLALWTDNETTTVKISFSRAPNSVVNYLGKPVGVSSPITVSDGPVYATFDNPSVPVGIITD